MKNAILLIPMVSVATLPYVVHLEITNQTEETLVFKTNLPATYTHFHCQPHKTCYYQWHSNQPFSIDIKTPQTPFTIRYPHLSIKHYRLNAHYLHHHQKITLGFDFLGNEQLTITA